MKTEKGIEEKKSKKYIWLSLLGLLIVPYGFVLVCGLLANQFIFFYVHATGILVSFIVLLLIFTFALIYSIVKYINPFAVKKKQEE